MSSQSIVCATCDATVPYGRLSCPACGELLASVAGAVRPAKARATTTRSARARATERAAPAVLVDVPPAAAIDTPFEAGRERPVAGGSLGVAGATSSETSTSTHGWEPPGWDTPEPQADDGANLAMDAAPVDAGVATDSADRAESAAPAAATAPSRDPAPVAWPADPAPPGAQPVAWPADHVSLDAPPQPARPPAPPRSVPDAPGAYVPPFVPAIPAGPPAPARAWAGQPAIDASAAATTDPPRSSIAGELLDAARVTEFVGWLAVAGSAMAAVGFLLPWGISVIGASGVGYFDRWGLAGPFHLIVFLSLLGLLALSLARNPIPLWIRVGVLGLGLGALLLGLTWPYIVGLSGTGPGAMVVALGALVLAAAGVGALASDRHAHEDQAV